MFCYSLSLFHLFSHSLSLSLAPKQNFTKFLYTQKNWKIVNWKLQTENFCIICKIKMLRHSFQTGNRFLTHSNFTYIYLALSLSLFDSRSRCVYNIENLFQVLFLLLLQRQCCQTCFAFLYFSLCVCRYEMKFHF